jgi:NDP-sugar pyrophosphorylase family protein
MLADIPVAVLAGGLGTRLRPVVADRPKPLALVAGRPFLAYLLDDLAAAGVQRVVLCTGHLGEMVEQVLGDSYRGLTLSYSCETQPLGTGGALRAAWSQIAADRVLVLNGDSLCGADLEEFAGRHAERVWGRFPNLPAERSAVASLVLAHAADTTRFGRVDTDDRGRVLEFVEKSAATGAGWVNAGMYFFERSVIEAIPANRQVSLEREVFPRLIEQGCYGYRTDAPLLDIGTPASLANAAHFLQPRIAARMPIS